jgi:hypothetical protein
MGARHRPKARKSGVGSSARLRGTKGAEPSIPPAHARTRAGDPYTSLDPLRPPSLSSLSARSCRRRSHQDGLFGVGAISIPLEPLNGRPSRHPVRLRGLLLAVRKAQRVAGAANSTNGPKESNDADKEMERGTGSVVRGRDRQRRLSCSLATRAMDFGGFTDGETTTGDGP